MAFFGLFGNKEKKNTEAASSGKKNILSLIQNIKLNCRNAEAVAALNKIEVEIQSQGETSDVNAIALGGEIQRLLAEANTYILKQQYPTAIAKLNTAFNKAVDRHQYCNFGGTMTKADKAAADKAKKMMDKLASQAVKTRAEELQEQIDQTTAELAALQTEFEQLKKLHEQKPSDASITSRATAVRVKIQTTQTLLTNLNVEMQKETVDTSIVEIAAANAQMVEGRTHDEAEMAVKRANVMAQNEQIKQTQTQVNEDLGLLGSAVGAMDPFATDLNAGVAAFDPFATDLNAGAAMGMGTQAGQATQAQYGGFQASEVGTAQMAAEIKKTMRAMEQSIEMYEDKIEEANEDFEDYNLQLRRLLEKRKTASPADCLVLDGQIDQVQSRRNGVTNKIMRYRQAKAELSDKLSLMDKLATQQDLTSTNAQIEKLTNGKFADFAGLSMFLNDSVKESNQKLEEIGIAHNIAESEEIMMGSASGASAALSDAGLVKDEHKYDALMEELTPTPRTLG
ncbi:MAG: hypothetical protein E7377_00285 [Clostridiales bacterium]|nr:hypothetical protein [Clostridiales bacterium]